MKMKADSFFLSFTDKHLFSVGTISFAFIIVIFLIHISDARAIPKCQKCLFPFGILCFYSVVLKEKWPLTTELKEKEGKNHSEEQQTLY